MRSVDRRLADYVAEHRAGGAADPAAFLARAPASERRELAVLIDAYLARAPLQPFDRAAFSGSTAERTVDELQRSLAGAGGLWPAVLPRLRHRAGLRRAEVVSRLAAALGAGDREARVAGYYHEMEQGRLPAAGVSDRVLEALGAILGESVPRLREAGAALRAAPHPPAGGPAFARRVADPDPEASATAAPRAAAAPASPPDDLDALFRGG